MPKYKRISPTILIILLLPIILTPTIAKPYDFLKSIEDLKQNNSFILDNMKMFALCIAKHLGTLVWYEDKRHFKDATEQEISDVIKTAKELGFSDKDIAKISVKIPQKSSWTDWTRNNDFSDFNTIILGEKTVKELKEIFKDQNVRKFVYAHELCHTKYNHSPKRIFYKFIASMIIVELTIRSFSMATQKLFSIFGFQQKIPSMLKQFLSQAWIKFSLQSIPFTLIEKISERNADLGAASLGPDVTKGGIKFCETWKKIQDDRDKAVLEKFDDGISKKSMSFLLALRNFVIWLTWDTHPSLEERIRYLKAKLLEFENQTKPGTENSQANTTQIAGVNLAENTTPAQA